ncbi:Minor extracellular protease vpr precursor [Arthrobacter saudimassiliensis]|uniref:Minor extracellular protease vpr n=1 Tax=Arthrobacter saudimassiliensis TaxID=1461584 RepID=A0A078MKU1_9MICC|nr:Minor extracellular protease vpr precursor [Arthrobacter saudimassiliensis]
MRLSKHRAGAGVVATLAGVALTAGLGLPAQAQETDGGEAPAQGIQVQDFEALKVSPSLRDLNGEVSAYVQFKGDGAFGQTQPEAVKEGREKPVNKRERVRQIRSTIEAQAQSAAAEASAEALYTTTNTLPGVAVRGDAEAIKALAGRDDVASITRIVPKTVDNKGADIDTRALDSWVQRSETGEGITIAVLDTGIDYTHSSFGGPGTVEAYQAAQASETIPAADSGLLDPEKFIGGYDLVGDDYNADPSSPTYQPVPKPDLNPLDCGGHGSHVAGTAAGYGTNDDGSTFRGDYTKLTAEEVNGMRIGPGSAPEAKLVGIRVFGCAGSSAVVGQALDYVLDPNGDGDFSDRAQVVNMSLGSEYAPYDDPENAIVDKLTELGILSVTSAGNSGDVYDVGGSPGNARSSLAVASSIGSQVTLDRADVLAPAEVEGTASGQYSSNFNYSDPAVTEERLTGNVVMAPANNRFGCEAFPAGSLAGKWVWIQWEENGQFPCGSGVRFNNAQAAGATGVVLDSPRSVFDAGIGGNAAIPGIQLNRDSSDRLRPAAVAGTLELRLAPQYMATATGPSESQDTISSFSSRGLHGSNGVVKPDVAAPGSSIGSVSVGSGDGASTSSGTSMAAPHVAGLAALMYAATDYNPYEVKTAIMNTATHDLFSAEGSVLAPNRVGSGRVDALDALNNKVLAYATDDPALTSVNFGVLELGDEALRLTRSITVENKSDTPRRYTVSYLESSTMPGVSVSTSPRVDVPANGKATVEVTLDIADPAALAKTIDPGAETEQLGLARQFLADVSGRVQLAADGVPTLRVPVYSAPKPTAAMSAGTGVQFADAEAGAADVVLRGRDLQQGEGSSRYLSLVAPLVLGAESPRLEKVNMESLRAMDLQAVGASSTLPALRAAGADERDAMLHFGVSTWDNWPILGGSNEINVEIDVNADGVGDYQVFTSRAADLDVVLVSTYRINPDGSGELVDQYGANGVLGDTDTNTFDTNVVTLPVAVEALGLDPAAESLPIQYRVTTLSPYNSDENGGNVPVDETAWIGFDASSPALWFSGATPEAGLFADVDGGKLTVNRGTEVTDAKALFLHLHNGTGDLSGAAGLGGRAEILPISVPAPVVNPVSAVAVCNAFKSEIKVTVTNPGDRRADITLNTPYGNAKVQKLQPGETRTEVIKTRKLTTAAGKVTADYKWTGGGKAEKAEFTAPFGAVKCSR